MKRKNMKRWMAAAAVVAAAPVFVGCSQMASLTPVAGDVVAGVGFATKDVLLKQGVVMKVVPVCSGKTPEFTCNGETLDGKKIVSTTSGTDADDLKVSVGGNQIFEGSVKAVITKAGRVS
jgi:hypothetical protein